MNVAVYQFAPEFGAVEKNLEKIRNALRNIETDLVVLPEFCTTGYRFISTEEVQALCEPVPDGKTIRHFERLCREKGIHLVAGIGEKDGKTRYNSAVLIGPKGYIGTYRKVHLFDEEKLWFRPGDTGFQVWDIGIARIGIMICFDWIFPESARTLSLKGADMICHPANLVLPYCPDAMITRSIENRIYSITANRTGSENRGGKELTFIGKSQVTGLKGEILFRMKEQEDGVRTAEIDPMLARNKRIVQGNDLFGDRRPETYRIQ